MLILLSILMGICSVVLSGVLWAYGGSFGTAWRKVGVPISIAIMGISFLYHNPILLIWHIASCVLLGIAITIPYGIPTIGDNPDKGSVVARFFYSLSGDLETAKFLTRLLCGMAYFGSLCLPLVVYGQFARVVFTMGLFVSLYIYLTCYMENQPPIIIGRIVLNFEETMIGLIVGIGGVICLL